MIGEIIQKINQILTTQAYKESASEIIKANNADLLQKIITNNENKELLFAQKTNEFLL